MGMVALLFSLKFRTHHDFENFVSSVFNVANI
jgi:hypothetical protein